MQIPRLKSSVPASPLLLEQVYRFCQVVASLFKVEVDAYSALVATLSVLLKSGSITHPSHSANQKLSQFPPAIFQPLHSFAIHDPMDIAAPNQLPVLSALERA